ncbi:DNA-binding response regulator [Pedobacter polaris]|uniref:DNA-binding response regulator n=1 Tax=Pedobacter polaris TaxID=2571273 RepID=A0A4U1CSK5_9SPHI|nr:LuxR C-terminal-related transcriptional regulator [Pedobacter polaris]TKC10030.1 DNA-binding response regulator [Pedobacter polaris]
MAIHLKKYSQIISYGVGFAVLLIIIKWLEIRFIVINYSFEIYASAIAVLFTALGIWIALKLTRPKFKIIEKEVLVTNSIDFKFNEKAFAELGLSKRELEVLQLMANGLSNQEIAEKLFVSLNTIKTHNSRLFEKMEVKRRTQAIEQAKKMSIIS